MTGVTTVGGRCLRGDYSNPRQQLLSQLQRNHPSILPSSKEGDKGSNRRRFDRKSGDNGLSNVPVVPPLSLSKTRSKKLPLPKRSSDTIVRFESQEGVKLKKTVANEEIDNESKTIVRVQLGLQPRGKVVTGLPLHKRSKSVPVTFVGDGPLWEVQNSRVLPAEKGEQLVSKEKVVKKSSRSCSCGLAEPRYCMLHLMEVVQRYRRPRYRQVTWIPMSLCTTYV